MKTYNELNGMTVAELRTHCRENTGDHNLTGVEIISLRKEELIKALTGQNVTERETLTLFNEVNAKSAPTQQSNDLADAIANALQGRFKSDVNIDQVNMLIDGKLDNINSMIDERLEALNDRKLEVEIKNIDTGKIKNVGIQHEQFETVCKLAHDRLNVSMVGTAGSGKTHMAEAIANALELPFYAISVGLQTSKSDLIGYMDANGNYIRTMLREAFENGGVFLIDEIDAGNANVLTVVNALTSNSIAAFPDGMIKKHADFIVLAAANTYGRGADRQYVGRNPLDGATVDRFAVIDVNIDEKLETAIAESKGIDGNWTRRVQAIRSAIFELKEMLICSPRATLNGGQAIKSGTMTFEEAENAFIFRGINNEIKERILRRVEGD